MKAKRLLISGGIALLSSVSAVYAKTLQEISIPDVTNWLDAAILMGMITMLLLLLYRLIKGMIKNPEKATSAYLGMPMLVAGIIFLAFTMGGQWVHLETIFPWITSLIMEYILKISIWIGLYPYLIVGVIALLYNTIRKGALSIVGKESY